MNSRWFYQFALSLVAVISTATVIAADHSDGLMASDAYIRTMPPGQKNTAAYLKLTNHSDRRCTVTGGKSVLAAKVEIHQHQHSDGMMKMRPVAALTLQSGETIMFQPGGYHLMLMGVKSQLQAGDSHQIELLSADCGATQLTAAVRSLFKASEPVMNMQHNSGHEHMMHNSDGDHP